MDRLDGKTAIIFGSARGIGRASAEAFVREGATVVGCDLADADSIAGAGSYEHRIIDATDEAGVDSVVAEVAKAQGHLDVVFNNVGIHLAAPLVDTTVAEFDKIVGVNLRSVFLGTRAALSVMLAQGSGSIICTASNGGVMGRPTDPVYNATKHAIVGLVRSVAVAHAHTGVRANVIAPGAIDTPLLRSLVPEGTQFEDPDTLRAFVASTPAARIGRPEEVAALAVLLASDEARFMNGATLPIDGAKSAGALPAERYSLDFELS
jgi:NAD(P)-dependent dehydrogenase (short-subunit alcohol dehydrogenase family)